MTPEPQFDLADATCLACGCLCDDISLRVEGGRVTAARDACEVGRRWFLADHSQTGVEPATINGRPVPKTEAVALAAEILNESKALVVLGLNRTATETVASALAIADRVGAVVDLDLSGAATAQLLAFQRVGRVSATLGEVKNRADLVVFWRSDPVATHPRHWERYSVEPLGRFVAKGRAGRFVIVADSRRTATAERADLFLKIEPDAEFETLWSLRAFLAGAQLEHGRVERATGLAGEALLGLIERFKQARYGAWFHDAPGSSAVMEAMLTLVRDLNSFTRFVILALGSSGNAAGAESVTAWQTGFAGRVDFSNGSPRFEPSSASAHSLLERRRADAALIVGDEAAPPTSRLASENLARIPRIVIGPRATAAANSATVALASATCGIDAPGTVTRTDGVVLPLRPPLAATLPTDRDWLNAIALQLSAGVLPS